ncbi:MAG TPA: helix-turn-helix domain-containing protein [Thermoanaerobaculia bacterium]|nr:helix-turn-helix domain-containing protein [Thermoanaerobaculia bacterium]
MPTDTGSFGDWLRRQREMREINLRDIAERTKISLRYLEAMEADRFDLLPAPIFAKGFLREYARYVGLSPDEVVNHYLAVQQPQDSEDPKEDTRVRMRAKPKPVDPGQPTVRRTWSYGLVLTLAGLILLALVALAAWFADKRRDEPKAEQSAPAMAAPPPALAAQPAPPPAPPEEPKAPLEVTLDFTKDCWVEALLDGKNRLAELRVQGESLQLEAQESILLQKLGDSGAVEIQVNGLALPLDKVDGQVVRDLMINLETARQLQEKKEAR